MYISQSRIPVDINTRFFPITTCLANADTSLWTEHVLFLSVPTLWLSVGKECGTMSQNIAN